jgi:hypothetical protein
LRRGALEALDEDDPEGLVLDELDELPIRVPVISTLCPTCGLNLLSSPSRRYVEPAVDALGADELLLELELLDPLVPVAFIALARMNPPLELELEPAVPVAPGVAVALDALRSRQP